MQKLYWLSCVINFTFPPKLYYLKTQPTPRGGVKRSKHFFSVSIYVACQIKGNGA